MPRLNEWKAHQQQATTKHHYIINNITSTSSGMPTLQFQCSHTVPAHTTVPVFSYSSNVSLVDGGPFSSCQGRLPPSSSCYASLLQVINKVMFFALCPQAESQAPQHFRASETQAICIGCSKGQSICSVISLDIKASLNVTLACVGQRIHSSLHRWMLNIVTCQSGLPLTSNGNIYSAPLQDKVKLSI